MSRAESTVVTPDSREAFERNGFAVLDAVIDRDFVEELVDALELPADGPGIRRRGGRLYAMRDLLRAVPLINETARRPPLASIAAAVLGPSARPVKATLFDKRPGANWMVPWHQDRTIAVRRRVDVAGFGPWSRKADRPHVEAPLTVLRQMVALRVHLDSCGPLEGALRVIQGTHRNGKLGPAEIERHREAGPIVTCSVDAGGVLLMRPLLLHASSAADVPSRRRVVHIEYAATELPGGLEWDMPP